MNKCEYLIKGCDVLSKIIRFNLKEYIPKIISSLNIEKSTNSQFFHLKLVKFLFFIS